LGHDRPRAIAAPLLALVLVPACFALAAWKSIPAQSVAPQIAVGPVLAQAQPPSGDVSRAVEMMQRLAEVRRRFDAGQRLLAQAQTGTSPSPPSPYQLWLKEDVAYIIMPQERTEFLGLQTDQQRQDFIAQFWLRRDPTPGTPRNEFQEEHYRRIAYANDHFGFEDTAGWRTDRGRIYISFGPPDERTVYEKGGDDQGNTITSPFERWRYRFIDGIGAGVVMESIDTARTGNFQMTRDPAGPHAGQRFVAPPR
jgi:GWxTD domain-containing protein